MELVKVINKMKNMMIQEFQQSMEFHLIEVMKNKMQMIQFESIPRVIQTRLIELPCIIQNILL
jgi:hypothetical protein